MTILKKLTAAAAASALSVGLMSAASAAVVLSSANGTNVLTSDNPIGLDNDDVNDGGALNPANNTAIVVVGEDSNGQITVSFDVNDSNGINTGIIDAVLTVMGDMGTMLSAPLTDGDGVETDPNTFVFSAMAGETLTFIVSGTGFSVSNPPFTPDYNIRLFTEEAVIPLPGAAVFLLTGLAGAGVARRRKKAA